jgi:hypothetical protein
MLHALAVINRIVAMIVTSVFSFMIADDDNTIYCKEGIFVCRFGCKSKTGVKSQTFSKFSTYISHLGQTHQGKINSYT